MTCFRVLLILASMFFVFATAFQAWCFYQIVTLGQLLAEEPNVTIRFLEYSVSVFLCAFSVLFLGVVIGYLWQKGGR